MNADSKNPSLNDLKCIWMTSGLVEYKLCNFRFDCENCEFDKVFRKNPILTEYKYNEGETNYRSSIDDLITVIMEEYFDEKLIYLKDQLVIKKIFGNVYYLGLNPVVLHLLDNFKSVVFISESFIKKGNAFLQVEGEWGKIEFRSPIDFVLIEKFAAVSVKPSKWIAIITTNESELDFYSADCWNDEKIKCLDLLKNRIGLYSDIGKTAMDGGEKVRSLYQILGREEYMKLVSGIFRR